MYRYKGLFNENKFLYESQINHLFIEVLVKQLTQQFKGRHLLKITNPLILSNSHINRIILLISVLVLFLLSEKKKYC